MFPTPVGMNREAAARTGVNACVPHTRGDEPETAEYEPFTARVFPTPVGMNRIWLVL